MRRKISCASLLLITGLIVNAQDPKLLDSLSRAKQDTNKVHLLWDIGASIIFQDPQKAIPYFRNGIELSEKLKFEPGLEKCNAATSTAFAFNAKHDSCLYYINKAIFYAKRIGNVNRLALVHLNRADVYKNMNEYTSALQDCDTAMKYADQSGNKDRMARIYNIISDVYELQAMYEPAMQYIQKAQAIYKEINNPQMTGQSYFDIATIHRKMGNLDKGVQSLQTAISIADSIKDIRNLSAFKGELAVLMIEKKNFSEAEALASDALEYARQTGNSTQEAVIQTVFYNIYFKQNQFQKAIAAGLAAYNLIRDKNDLGREQNIAGMLAEAYEKTGNTKEAYHFLSTSKKLNDSLMAKRFSEETAKLQARFELNQKDKEILLLNKDKELQDQKLSRQRVLFIASVALGVLLLGGIVLLVSRYRLRQRIKEMQLRNQIAADLHDEVGSSLSSIHMLSEMATAKQDAGQKEILHRVSSYTRETMDKMSDIVWMIKPSEKEGLSLKERMERFLYEMCNSRQLNCSFEWEGPELSRLNMEQRKAIYLVFKEAVNNALKYAHPKSIAVKLRTDSRMVKLTVKDDGKGFDAATIKKGNGLENMKTRAEELGGQTVITSSESEGTQVSFSIPV